LIELKFIIKVYDPNKLVSISSNIGGLLERKVSIGGTQFGLSQKGCLIVAQPVLKGPIGINDAVNGILVKMTCNESEDAFLFISQLSSNLSPHESTIELVY